MPGIGDSLQRRPLRYSGAVKLWRVRRCAMALGASGVPPEVLVVGHVELRRQRVNDAEGIADAVKASLPELKCWMPWATDEATDVGFQRRRLEATLSGWEDGADFSYVIVEDRHVIGCMGLHGRIGPGALEIGYWLRSDCTGRGIATSCGRALTGAALELVGVERVEVHCDEANVRSAAIPRRLGYRLDRT